MAAVFETFYSDLRAVILATWPDTAGNGIWETEDIQKMPWDQLKIPLGVIEIAEMPISPDWGIANETHEGIVSMFWVGATSGNSATQRARAEALRDALLTASLSNACILDVADVQWSNDLPLNMTFAQKNYVQRACMVSANVIVYAKRAT